jgi:hypothetical protein
MLRRITTMTLRGQKKVNVKNNNTNGTKMKKNNNVERSS